MLLVATTYDHKSFSSGLTPSCPYPLATRIPSTTEYTLSETPQAGCSPAASDTATPPSTGCHLKTYHSIHTIKSCTFLLFHRRNLQDPPPARTPATLMGAPPQ